MDPIRAIFLSCLCLILLGAVLTWQTEEVYSELLIIPAVVAAGAYALAPQIRWWYWKRNPPDLSTELAPLLDRFPLYRALDLTGKREFRRRTFLLREATDFQGKGIEGIPDDVRLMVAGSAAVVTFHRDEFLVEGFENIIFYPHQFPTPEHQRLHASELYTPDGAIIWTLNYLVRSVVEPDKYLQLGIYEYVRALMHLEPDFRAGAAVNDLDYDEIRRLAGFSEGALTEFIGLENPDRTAITVTLFHTHGPAFTRQFPHRFERLRTLMPHQNLA